MPLIPAGWEREAGRLYYINIIFEFHAPGAVELHILQSCTHHIIWLAFWLLSSFDHGRFIKVATVFDVQSVECILERKYLALIKLRKTPTWIAMVSILFLLNGERMYFWSLKTFILSGVTTLGQNSWGVHPGKDCVATKKKKEGSRLHPEPDQLSRGKVSKGSEEIRCVLKVGSAKRKAARYRRTEGETSHTVMKVVG